MKWRRRVREPKRWHPDLPLVGFPADEEAQNLGREYVFSLLFPGIAASMPKDATLYLEGNPVPEIEGFLAQVAVEPQVEVERGTESSRVKLFHIPLSATTLGKLSELADRHAEPEICDHLVVYKDKEFLLWAHDAGASDLYVSPSISEDAVERLRRIVSWP